MHSFKDNEGRTWAIEIHVSAVKRVRALADVDLYGLVDDGFESLSKLLKDPVKLVDVLFCLCMEKAEERGITDEAFGRAMAGDAIREASDAFLEELIDFFPDPRVRAGLRGVVEKARRVGDLMMAHLEERLGGIDPAAEARRLIGSSGGSPESSGSTRGRSP